MSMSILPFLRSAEFLNHVNPQASNYANAAYAQTSVQSFDYQSVSPQTQQTSFGQKHTFFPYKPEAIISQLQWKCTVSALTISAGSRDAFNYLRWKRWAPLQGIESVKIIFGNEAVETYPGYWIWLQLICFDDPKKRQREEVWDYSDAERDVLSASAATFHVNLKPFCLRHQGVYLPTHALREQFRIEITTRALAKWYDTNMSGTVSASITSDELLVEYTVLPPAELKTYIDKPFRVPMKTESHIEQETITAATSHNLVLTYKGVVEGYFFGFRKSTLAGSGGTDEYLKMDRLADTDTLTFKINNQAVINAWPVAWFYREAYKYLPHRPQESDDMYWLYVPLSLAADKMAASGGMDHNTPTRIEFTFAFGSAFTGDVTVVSPVRNIFAIRSGKAQKRYA